MMRKKNNSAGLLGCASIPLIGLINLALFIGFWALVIYLLVWFLRYLEVIK